MKSTKCGSAQRQTIFRRALHERAFVGVDEAGLGPTLGPYVVAGTTIVLEPGAAPLENTEPGLLAPAGSGIDQPLIELGDSKAIYSGARKLARLERTALAGIACRHGGRLPRSDRELFDLACPSWTESEMLFDAPWYHGPALTLPVAQSPGDLERACTRLQRGLRARGVRLAHHAATVISAQHFNCQLEAVRGQGGTKNTWATRALIQMAARARAAVDPSTRTSIVCDRAGGRMRYGEALAADFASDAGVGTSFEHPVASRYEIVGPQPSTIEFRIRAESSQLAVAWASCLAKYLRELVMIALNRHFHAALDGDLRPTAGYPLDARRFISDVRDLRSPPASELWIRQG